MRGKKIIIVGLGSIGQRHAGILRDHFSFDLFALRSKGKDSARNTLGIPELHSWEEVKELKPDIAFITNPTYAHIKTAFKCASLGMHVFIEKPLSNNPDGIAALEVLCRKKKLTCYTAYCLRFHPVIKELRQLIIGQRISHVRVVCSSYLPSWRKGTDSKQSYSGIKRQGGGVLLDVSHEFDYIKYLFGDFKIISGVYGKAANVSVDAEDFADVLLRCPRAPYINLHLNFLSRLNERRIIINSERGFIIADLLENTIEVVDGFKKKIKRLKGTRDDYLKEQINYFLWHLGDPSVMNNIKEAKSILNKILRFKRND